MKGRLRVFVGSSAAEGDLLEANISLPDMNWSV